MRAGSPRGSPRGSGYPQTDSRARAGSPRGQRTAAPVAQPSLKALVLKGMEGSYRFMNSTYEPFGTHNKRPAWFSKDPSMPAVIFHNGKTRWVISGEINDGGACYAFISDDSTMHTPVQAQKNGMRWNFFCEETHKWNADARITCHEQAASGEADPFFRLKQLLKKELDDVGVTNSTRRAQFWRMVDRNGDGYVDQMEIETAIRELTRTKAWPDFMNCEEDILARAFQMTLQDDEDGMVDKDEFQALLGNVFWFAKLHPMFAQFHGSNNTLGIREAERLLRNLGIELPRQEVDAMWHEADKDNNKVLSFDEFADFVRFKVCGHSMEHVDHLDNASKALKEMKSDGACTSGIIVRSKNFADFDHVEAKIKKICAEPNFAGLRKLWESLDYNGNGHVSLAEVDKWVVERYSLLNHKPALMRAFQASKNKDGKQKGHNAHYVQRKEFKLLLVNCFYYNKLFWLFDQADEGRDRRVDFPEFQHMMALCSVRMSQEQAKSEFDKVDRNGGGQILFDEFCAYFVGKRCPEGMSEFITD